MVEIHIGVEVVEQFISQTVSAEYLDNIVKDTVITKEKDTYGIESVTRVYKKDNYNVEVNISDNDIVSVDIVDNKLSVRVVSMHGNVNENEIKYTVESYNDVVFDYS